MRKLLLLLALVPTGCGVSVVQNPDPTPISGKVTVAGKPITGVMLNMQPTGPGSLPKTIPITDGSFNADLNPGRYMYFISRGPSEESFELVPAEYKEGSLDRQVDIAAGKPLDIEM